MKGVASCLTVKVCVVYSLLSHHCGMLMMKGVASCLTVKVCAVYSLLSHHCGMLMMKGVASCLTVKVCAVYSLLSHHCGMLVQAENTEGATMSVEVFKLHTRGLGVCMRCITWNACPG